MFHRLDALAPEESAENTRQFDGDGTPYLKVPGLMKVESVRIGKTSLPLEMEMEWPTDPSLTTIQKAMVPFVVLEHTEEGEAVLLRSMQSNDGIWQKGQKIFVTGAWSRVGERETLLARAKELGINPVGKSTDNLRELIADREAQG